MATLIEAVQTRLELLVTDLEEEKQRLTQIIVLGLGALFSLALAVVLLTLFVVAIFWDTHRLLAVGTFVILYFGLGVTLALMVRKRITTKPRLLSTVLTELAKDRRHLSSDVNP